MFGIPNSAQLNFPAQQLWQPMFCQCPSARAQNSTLTGFLRGTSQCLNCSSQGVVRRYLWRKLNALKMQACTLCSGKTHAKGMLISKVTFWDEEFVQLVLDNMCCPNVSLLHHQESLMWCVGETNKAICWACSLLTAPVLKGLACGSLTKLFVRLPPPWREPCQFKTPLCFSAGVAPAHHESQSQYLLCTRALN